MRIGAVVGSLFVLLLPSLAVLLTQDLTCRDGGVMPRPNGGLVVVCVTAVALLGLLGLFWATGDRPPGTAWRLAVIPAVLLVPLAIIEVMAASLPLEDYCDGLRGVLHLQAGLALLVPVAAMALAAVPAAPTRPSRVPRFVAMGSVLGLLPVQAAAIAERLPADALVCIDRQPLPADALTMRGPDTNLSMAAADFDRDGAMDLGGFDESGTARVLRNDGRGTLTPAASAALPTTFAPTGAVAAGDLDGNGYPDLVVAGGEVAPPHNIRRRGGVAVVLNDGRNLRPRGPLLLPGNDGLPLATSTGTGTSRSSWRTAAPSPCSGTGTVTSSRDLASVPRRRPTLTASVNGDSLWSTLTATTGSTSSPGCRVVASTGPRPT